MPFIRLLYDNNKAALSKCVEKIKASLEKLFNQRKIPEKHFQKALISLWTHTSFDFLNQIDIVIEAVPEDYFIKEVLFKEINPFLKENTILASNTSSLSINILAKTYCNCKEGRTTPSFGTRYTN
jgi:3-hydroxyacyl-CoA dehydrogenase